MNHATASVVLSPNKPAARMAQATTNAGRVTFLQSQGVRVTAKKKVIYSACA